MANAHYFMIEDLDAFVENLEGRRYLRSFAREGEQDWVVYSKEISGALIKYYTFPDRRDAAPAEPTRIRVTYQLLKDGQPLARLARELKQMNEKYRKALPGWKTKRAMPAGVRDRRWDHIQDWIARHIELIDCFKYQGHDQLTEGNPSFNLMIASTPREQRVCFDFIKTLAESFAPTGIIRGRRQADNTRQQRNGWIRRYARLHRKRGWTAVEIANEIQKELRAGTWDERQRLQYNLANNTILKIAGLKLPVHHAFN